MIQHFKVKEKTVASSEKIAIPNTILIRFILGPLATFILLGLYEYEKQGKAIEHAHAEMFV